MKKSFFICKFVPEPSQTFFSIKKKENAWDLSLSFRLEYCIMVVIPHVYFILYCLCVNRAGIFKLSMGARNLVGIGLSYRPARLHRLAEFILVIYSWAP